MSIDLEEQVNLLEMPHSLQLFRLSNNIHFIGKLSSEPLFDEEKPDDILYFKSSSQAKEMYDHLVAECGSDNPYWRGAFRTIKLMYLEHCVDEWIINA